MQALSHVAPKKNISIVTDITTGAAVTEDRVGIDRVMLPVTSPHCDLNNQFMRS